MAAEGGKGTRCRWQVAASAGSATCHLPPAEERHLPPALPLTALFIVSAIPLISPDDKSSGVSSKAR
jgi:hypothetical protein